MAQRKKGDKGGEDVIRETMRWRSLRRKRRKVEGDWSSGFKKDLGLRQSSKGERER